MGPKVRGPGRRFGASAARGIATPFDRVSPGFGTGIDGVTYVQSFVSCVQSDRVAKLSRIRTLPPNTFCRAGQWDYVSGVGEAGGTTAPDGRPSRT